MGVIISKENISYLANTKSNIQIQLNDKLGNYYNIVNGEIIRGENISHLSNTYSNIQTQLNDKSNLTSDNAFLRINIFNNYTYIKKLIVSIRFNGTNYNVNDGNKMIQNENVLKNNFPSLLTHG